MTNTDGFGQMDAGDTTTDFNRSRFHIDQMLMRTRTMVLVQVKSVSGGGLTSPAKVSIQPLVNMIDGAGNSQAHGSINNIPCIRGQGGSNAIVNDPVVGEIGIALIADRDSSGVISGKAAANPGSRRRHDLADGVYLGSILGPTPNQYLQFLSSGLTLVDQNGNKLTFDSTGFKIVNAAGTVTIQAVGSNLNITATTEAVTGNITATGTITAELGASHVGLSTHTHSASGAGPPNPGT